MVNPSHLQKAEAASFTNGQHYGFRKGREEGFEQAFLMFMRMLEVEKERTTNMDRRMAIRDMTLNTIALKDVICL